MENKIKTSGKKTISEALLKIHIDGQWTHSDFLILFQVIDTFHDFIIHNRDEWENHLEALSRIDPFIKYNSLELNVKRINFNSPGIIEFASVLTPIIGFITYILKRYVPNQKERQELKLNDMYIDYINKNQELMTAYCKKFNDSKVDESTTKMDESRLEINKDKFDKLFKLQQMTSRYISNITLKGKIKNIENNLSESEQYKPPIGN